MTVQSVKRLATGRTVRGLNPGGGEIFRTRPERLWGPHSHLYSGYRVFPWGKAAEAWRWPPTPTSAVLKERVELYIYSPSGPSWPVLGWTFPLPWFNLKITSEASLPTPTPTHQPGNLFLRPPAVFFAAIWSVLFAFPAASLCTRFTHSTHCTVCIALNLYIHLNRIHVWTSWCFSRKWQASANKYRSKRIFIL
jgi:hypothetical protein